MGVCDRCNLCRTARTVRIWGDGSGNPDILFVGRDPGNEEDIAGKPFVGRSGKLLRGMVSEAGIDQGRVRYTNCVRCHTPNNVGPTPEQLAACKPYLYQEIVETNPRLIVALGLEAAKSLLGVSGTLRSLRGSPRTVSIGDVDRTILVTYHPSAILRNPSLASDFAMDISTGLDILSGTLKSPESVVVHKLRNIEDVRDLVHRVTKDKIPFQFDLETSGIYPWTHNRILCCSLAYERDSAYVFPISYGMPGDGEVWSGVKQWESEVIPLFRELLESDVPKGGHNTFGVDSLYPMVLYGIRVKNAKYDTLLMHYALDERVGTHGLDILAARVGMAGYDKEMAQGLKDAKSGGVISYARVKWDTLSWYCAMDSVVSLLLRDSFLEEFRQNKTAGRVYNDILIKSSLPLLELTLSGVKIDTSGLSRVKAQMDTAVHEVEEKIRSLDCVKKFEEQYFSEHPSKVRRFNPASSTQLSYLLYDIMGEKTNKVSKKTGKPSTSKLVLSDLSSKNELAGLVLELRGILKERDTYLKEIVSYTDTNGFLHPGFRLFTTVTGRLSSSDPALQNFPKKSGLRTLFISRFAPHGCLVEADESQMELRVLAQLSGDKLLRNAYCESGRDIHRLTASQIFDVPEFDEPVSEPKMILHSAGAATVEELGRALLETPNTVPRSVREKYKYDPEKNVIIRIGVTKAQRDHAKRVNFGIVYGIQDVGLSAQLGVSREVAAEYIQQYLRKFSGVAAYIESVKKYVRRKKYVRSVFGRTRHLPEIASQDPGVVSEAERQAVNFTIQSPASDITLFALHKVLNWLRLSGLKSVVWNIIHDAILLDCPLEELYDVAAAVKIFMEDRSDYPWLQDVPLVADVSIGENWAMCKSEGADITEALDRYINGVTE